MAGAKLKNNQIANEDNPPNSNGESVDGGECDTSPDNHTEQTLLANDTQPKDQGVVKASSGVLQIQTVIFGFNSGRTYCVRIPSLQLCQQVMEALSKAASAARAAFEAKTAFRRSQETVRAIYNSGPFQFGAALLIFAVRPRPTTPSNPLAWRPLPPAPACLRPLPAHRALRPPSAPTTTPPSARWPAPALPHHRRLAPRASPPTALHRARGVRWAGAW